jgi:hypothetical protein
VVVKDTFDTAVVFVGFVVALLQLLAAQQLTFKLSII